MTNLFNEKMLENLCIADNIVTAEDGEEALKYLERSQTNHTYPELILVDIFMPKMSGWMFLEKFSKMKFEKERKPAVVVLTHSHDAGNYDQALSIPGVIGFLNKPLTEADVMEILNQHFRSVVAHE
jgi:CheY-like chemotaxis protein